MPKPSPLRFIKRWRRYEERGDWRYLLHITRGVYVLYDAEKATRSSGNKRKVFRVVYIGVSGVAKNPTSGIGGRLRQHNKSKTKRWTHYSFFEVHDNISREEILELESFLLAIFRHDPRIDLDNKQKGSGRLAQLRRDDVWSDVDHGG